MFVHIPVDVQHTSWSRSVMEQVLVKLVVVQVQYQVHTDQYVSYSSLGLAVVLMALVL